MKKAISFLFLCLLGVVGIAACQDTVELPPGYTAIDADPTGEVVQGICTEYACDSEGNNCSYFPSGCGTGGGSSGGGGGAGGGAGVYCSSWMCSVFTDEACGVSNGQWIRPLTGQKFKYCSNQPDTSNPYDRWYVTETDHGMCPPGCPN